MPSVAVPEGIHSLAYEELLRLFFGELRGKLQSQAAHYRIDFDPTEVISDRGVYRDIRFPLDMPTLEEHCDALYSILPIDERRRSKILFYRALSTETGRMFPWGALTGIRPSFVAAEIYRTFAQSSTFPERDSALYLRRFYGLEASRASLAVEVARREMAIEAEFEADANIIYFHIPFCSSRCSYCSFPASDGLTSRADVHRAYLDQLFAEYDHFVQDLDIQADVIYIGGGTPSIFNLENLKYFCDGLSKRIDFHRLREASFEAGRADSLSEEKLRVLRDTGFDHICLNPQSSDVSVLRASARPLDLKVFEAMYQSARRLGFTSINMDLILGLPSSSVSDFLESLRYVMSLGADAVSLHSLALKRSSDLMTKHLKSQLSAEPGTSDPLADLHLAQAEEQLALDEAGLRLRASGYLPYYLYKHKLALGGLENLSYARATKETAYNVLMMGDRRQILSFGAGASSKFLFQKRLKRFTNVATIREYQERHLEMAEKKHRIYLQSHGETRDSHENGL
ncbi:MAG: radical SAM protein [Eubacteriales bacterium]|nr:radical SAM protein [Eubacteriales bacterium]